jgi:ribonuclease
VRGAVLSLLSLLVLPARAGGLDYDAFSDREGNVTTEQQGRALYAVLQEPERLEVLYTDSIRGDRRARRVFQTLEEDYFPDIGRELAELVSRPPCLVPAVRELSGWCVPQWSFVDFLRPDHPGGAKLRKALFGGFEARAKQRQLETQVVVSAMNALVGVGVAAVALREAAPAAIGVLEDIAVTSRGKLVLRGTVDLRATLEAIQSGKLAPRDVFRNAEGLLPKQPPGYYQEFVHPTPGVNGVGPQRIIRGQSGELYYTPDHYQSFIRLNR